MRIMRFWVRRGWVVFSFIFGKSIMSGRLVGLRWPCEFVVDGGLGYHGGLLGSRAEWSPLSASMNMAQSPMLVVVMSSASWVTVSPWRFKMRALMISWAQPPMTWPWVSAAAVHSRQMCEGVLLGEILLRFVSVRRWRMRSVAARALEVILMCGCLRSELIE